MSTQQTELTSELLDKKIGPLFVRCLVEIIHNDDVRTQPKCKTTIHLFDYWMDTDEARYYAHLVYTDQRNMNGEVDSWKPLVGIELSYLSSDQTLRFRELDRILDQWRGRTPSWIATKQMVACVKNGRDLREFSPTSREMLQHYARLETRLAYAVEMHKLTGEWIPCELFYHVSALLRDCNREWDRTVGRGIPLD